MAKPPKEGFWDNFKRFFIRGLVTLLPTVLTIWLLVQCFQFIQQNISVYMTEGVIRLVALTTEGYPKLTPADEEEYLRAYPQRVAEWPTSRVEQDMRLWKLRQLWSHGPRLLVGFLLAMVFVYVVGLVLASWLGRRIWGLFEGTVRRVPGFKQVYPYVKQVTDFLFGENKLEFSRVVTVQYPRAGLWTLGLVTGAGFRYLGEHLRQETVTVFIPSTPTPVTGFIITVPKDEVVDLPLTIEEAFRFVISGGVIVPAHQSLPTQRLELAPVPAAAGTAPVPQEQPAGG
jgi:uncharacterized membrane protein